MREIRVPDLALLSDSTLSVEHKDLKQGEEVLLHDDYGHLCKAKVRKIGSARARGAAPTVALEVVPDSFEFWAWPGQGRPLPPAQDDILDELGHD